MTTRRGLFPSIAAVCAAVCALVLAPSTSASAHPLGNFTVNRYDGLVVAPGALRVDHVEDLAEIPATQARPAVQRLGLTEWARERCAAAAEGSRLTVDGREVAVTARSGLARVRPGQAGLTTLRVECVLTAPLPEDASVGLRFAGAGGAAGGPGWREITARGDRTTVTASDVPTASVSHELTSYPAELLSSPADTATASLRVRPGGPALAEEPGDSSGAPGAAVLPRGADRWTRALESLVARHDLTVGFSALALLIAVVLGAGHALAPGHGKTLMAATAAARGGRARLKDVLPLAASVTVTHTLGVVALGLLVTAGSALAPSVITWLGAASGALVVAAGLTLTRRAWRARRPAPAAGPPAESVPEKTPEPALALAAAPGGHHRHHEHDGPRVHHAHHGHREHEGPHVPRTEHGHREHERPHVHRTDHDHREHERPHVHHAHHDHPEHDDRRVHHASHAHHVHHRHPHALEHTHGGVTHTHPTAPTLRGTILLGFAGGLVPSPSAVVVLVGAAALGKAWFGLLLVVAYGVGLALTLGAAGFAVVRLGTGVNRMLDRRPRWTSHPFALLVRRSAPLVSALLVVAIGVGLMLNGASTAFG
ncbi:nickel transporter [Streptomyces griseoviridis]|uniref:Nickel transporter n=1 Tax=Streptomyces griseoviridis TaxID=45398 RepID=A0A3Q9KRY0_STRGD|nr:nickel transporter [Streptomyces griseoviridis]AZS88176.1 nickel transporter [Streptomyces griseoviridis]QCN84978.1 nickel transporter [Streptomyces griseoviridis]